MRVLRPLLYKRLQARLGSVQVKFPGEEADGRVVERDGRKRRVLLRSGEYYAVCCPFCGDRYHRLWINHLWGKRDAETGTLNLWLCICYNERCVEDFNRCRQLYQRVFDDIGPFADDPVLVAPEPKFIGERPPRWPGPVQLLSELAPSHPARTWIGQRYDPDWLAAAYGVGYCPVAESWCRPASGRLIIPFRQAGHFCGWQARYIGKEPRHLPRYYSMPGLKKQRLLYNWDQAQHEAFLVFVEGPTACWSFGPEAVGLLGKSFSQVQLEKVGGRLGRPQPVPPWQAIVVLLDGNAATEAAELAAALARCAGGVDRFLIKLPPDKQPGSYPRSQLRQMVYRALARQGVVLPQLLENRMEALSARTGL